jgi:hypothetical protein
MRKGVGTMQTADHLTELMYVAVFGVQALFIGSRISSTIGWWYFWGCIVGFALGYKKR